MTIKTIESRLSLPIALSVLFLFGIVLLMHFKTLAWPFGIIDSPIILAQALQYSPLEYFTSPYKYQFLSFNNLTPWVTLSWDFDYSLFQLEPFGYRLHQLASMSALLAITYLLIYRMTASVVSAGVFSLAVITAPATLGVVDDLVNRHYLEGMIFCLLSFFCAQKYNREQSAPVWLVCSALLYGLSITAKEVFIPLPGIIFFLLAGNLRRKIVLILPYAFVLGLYLAWRWHMLSGVGGYTSATDSLDMIGNWGVLVAVSQKLFGALFVSPAASVLMLLLPVLLLAINFRKLGIYGILGMLVGVFGLVLPLIALLPLLSVGFFSPRWIFAPTIGLLLFLAYLSCLTKSKALTAAVYFIVVACSISAFYQRTQEPIPAYVKGDGKVYKTILQSDADHYIQMSNFSQLAGQGQSIWVYIAKMHNGNWGTLQASDSGQLHFHDTANKTEIKMGRKKIAPENALTPNNSNLDLIDTMEFDSDTGALNVSFAEGIPGERCFVYVFGEHNGMLFGDVDCRQWSTPYYMLTSLVRMTGYELAETSIAVWPQSRDERIYSRAYKVSELIDLGAVP